jgi:hypothetical protein
VSVCVTGLCTDTQLAVCQNVQCELSHNKFISLVFGLLKLTASAVGRYTGGLKQCTAFIAYDWMFSKF